MILCFQMLTYVLTYSVANVKCILNLAVSVHLLLAPHWTNE